MPTRKDLYAVLGVSRDANADEIKKAYRSMARKYHPDVNKDDKQAADKFKEISSAYEILSDPDKRALYDRYGHDAFDPTKGGGFNTGGDFGGFGGFDFGGINDIFDLFGGGLGGYRRSAGPRRGADREVSLQIDFEDAFYGMEKQIEIMRVENCEVCKGSGAAPGSKVSTCPDCNGTGQVRNVRSTAFGRFETVNSCGRCSGTGEIIEEPCRNCRGRGKVKKRRKINVKIPAGIDNGSRLRIAGEGEEGTLGGDKGDLYISILVRPHRRFEREQNTLICEQEIDFVQAILGDKIKINLLRDETVELDIPSGTQPGSVLTVRGRGVPYLNSTRRGDLKVIIKIKIPKKANRRQRELLEQFYDKEEKKTLFERIKESLD